LGGCLRPSITNLGIGGVAASVKTPLKNIPRIMNLNFKKKISISNASVVFGA
jgi:hypothetical protein